MADNKLELVVEVDTGRANASIKQVNAGLSSIEKTAVDATRGASRGIDGMTASMTKAVLAGNALYDAAKKALGALKSMTLGALELQDQMGKSAQKVGLSVEAYSELRHVAELSGITAEQLATSVGILSRNMLEAAQRAGEQRQAFQAIGVSLRDQSGYLRNANDMLADLADRFESMPDSTMKTALAMQLFGRSGREMIPFLNQGGAEIRRLRVEARALGIVVGEEAFRSAEKFNDNLRRIQKASEGLKIAIANELLPKLTELSDKMLAWIKSGGLQQAVAYLKDFAEAARAIGVGIATYAVITKVKDLTAAITALNAAMLANPWTWIAAGVAAFGAVVYREIQRTDKFRESLERANKEAAVFAGIASGRTLEQLKAAGFSESDIKAALAGRSIEPFEIESPVKLSDLYVPDEEERRRILDAEKRAAEILRQAREAELSGLARIVAEYERYRQELGLTAKAQKDLAAALEIRVRAQIKEERDKAAKDALSTIEKMAEFEDKARAERMRRDIEFANETLDLQQQTARERLRYEETVAEQVRDARLRQLELEASHDADSQIRAVQHRLEIEQDYLMQRFALRADELRRESELEIATMETVARARGIAEEQIAARRDAILRDYAERGRQLDADTQAALDAARETAAIRQAQIIRDHNQRIFDSLKRQAEGVFDALLTRSQSVWSTIANSLKTAILTAIKEILSSQVVALLMRLFTGVRMPVGAGGLAGLAGLAAPAFGMGAPISGGAVEAMGSIGAVSAGGLGLGGLSAAGLAPLGLGGATLGLTGAFRLGQRGGLGAAFGVGLGAFSGLLGFGALTSMFPALVAAGPVGWIAAAGVGAFAGLLGLFRKSAEQKAREKIRATYSIDIRDKGILRQIVEMAKQGFGGNLDMAIRSQPVRELIELYAVTTGQSTAGLPPTMRPVSLLQQDGALYQQTFSSAAAPSLDRIGGGTPQSAGPLVINITVPGAKEFFEKETVRVVVENPRAVQSAALTATRANAGRRQLTALQLSPGLVVG